VSGKEGNFNNGRECLDVILHNLRRGELTVVAGRPGTGKTTVAVATTLEILQEKDIPVVFFSLDSTREELINRFDENGVLHKYESNSKLVIIDSVNTSVDSISEVMHKFLSDNIAEQKAVAIIDYFGLISTLKDLKDTSREEAIADIMRKLKSIAEELRIPVVVTAQLRRTDSDSTPGIKDMTQGMEQEADSIIILDRKHLSREKSAEKGLRLAGEIDMYSIKLSECIRVSETDLPA
jgi:replicative DNA helicase